MSDTEIKICSLNCQGLGDQKKRRDVLNYMRSLKYSIICLQDTHFSKTNERIIEKEWVYRTFLSSFNSRSRGVAILFNNYFEFKVHKTFRDASRNYLLIDLEIN